MENEKFCFLFIQRERKSTAIAMEVDESQMHTLANMLRTMLASSVANGPTDISPLPINAFGKWQQLDNSGHFENCCPPRVTSVLSRSSSARARVREHTCREKCIAQLICVSSLPARPLFSSSARSSASFFFFFFSSPLSLASINCQQLQTLQRAFN